MPLSVLEQAVISALRLVTDQEAERDALRAPFGANPVTIRFFDGVTHVQTTVQGPVVADTLVPRGFRPGAFVSSTVLVPGRTISHAIFRTAGGTDIFSVPAAELSLSSPTTQAGRAITVNDPVLGGMRIMARLSLPVTSAPTRALTFVMDDTAVATGAAVAGLITSTGNQAQAWSITAPSGVTVSPSSGTLPAGATQALSVTAAEAGTYSITLVAAGATITGNPQSLVVSAAPAQSPSSATIALGSTATVGVPLAGTITLDRSATVAVTVNLTITGGALSSASVVIGVGQSSAAFTATGSAVGTPMVVTLASTNPALTIAGSPRTVTVGNAAPPIEAGVWQDLSFAPHSRRVVTGSAFPVGPYSTIPTQLFENTPETITSSVPRRGFNPTIRGEFNTFYLVGSMHSAYCGNEIDRFTMPTGSDTVITVEVSHPANASANGPNSGYDTSSSGYIYKPSHTPDNFVGFETQETAAGWQTIKGHTYTFDTWHPKWGFCEVAAHALQTGQAPGAPYYTGTYVITNGVLQSSYSQPTDGPNQGLRGVGMVSFDWVNKRYLTHFSSLNMVYPHSAGLGRTAITDFNYWDSSILLFNNTSNAGNATNGLKWETKGTLTSFADVTAASDSPNQALDFGGESGSGDNGILVRHLEIAKYLVLRSNFNGLAGLAVKLYSPLFVHWWTGYISGTTMTVTSNDRYAFPGTHVTGPGVAPNTTIVRQLTGTKNLNGTYEVSVSQTVGAPGAAVVLRNHPRDRLKDLTPQLPGSGPGEPFEGADGNTGNPLTFFVDRNSRRIFWMVYTKATNPLRFYLSTFDDIMSWTRVQMEEEIFWPSNGGALLTLDRQPVHFSNGNFYFNDFNNNAPGPLWIGGGGSLQWRRVKVDQGEDLPPMRFVRYDYRIQEFRFSAPASNNQLNNTKHCNFAYDPASGKHIFFGGDNGGNTSQAVATLQFTGDGPGDYTFEESLNEVADPAPGTLRPSSADDGHWFHVPMTSAWIEGRGKLVWKRGGEGVSFFQNEFLRAKYGASGNVGTIAQVQAAQADGWDLAHKFYLYDPAARTFGPLGVDFSFNTNGQPGSASANLASYEVSNRNGWTQDNGSTFYPDMFNVPSSTIRNGAFDSSTGCLWCFANTGSPSLAKFDFVNKAVTMFNLATWLSPETGTLWYTSGSSPLSDEDVIPDGTKEKFGYLQLDNGRHIVPLGLNWEWKATWIDERDGKLYVVEPSSGYLWCFETRGTVTNSDGYRLPFYPVGKRAPLVGTYPIKNSRDRYPPEIYDANDGAGGRSSGNNGETRMSQFMVPFKGGLLWWGAVHHTGGSFGYPTFTFWRRIGYTGDWTVVSMPQEFAANSHSPVSFAHDNNDVALLAGGGNYEDLGGSWDYFWRLT